MAKKGISVASRKAKARWIQDKVTMSLREIFKVDKDLTPQEDGALISSRQMGGSGVDIVFSPIIRRICNWAIECKNGSSISILSSWRQTVTNATKAKGKPIMFIKYPEFQQPLVILRYEDYLKEYGDIVNFALDILNRYYQLEKLHNDTKSDNTLSRLSEIVNILKKLESILPMRELDKLRKEYHEKEN